MVQQLQLVRRDAVQPGTVFYANENRVPCIALESTSLNKRFKRSYWGGASLFWHCYMPTGSVSWMAPESMVLVNAEHPFGHRVTIEAGPTA